jgi:hypothetical protein
MVQRAAVFILAAGVSIFGTPERDVSICVEGKADLPSNSLYSAENTAAAIYSVIGIRLRWHTGTSCLDTQYPIRITVVDHAPKEAPADVLAYAHPYDGQHILVIYDRISRLKCYCDRNPAMGYVLAHEIAHLFEGVVRHSQKGIMKAHWERADYEAMLKRSLRFAPEDISLIHLGLKTWTARR